MKITFRISKMGYGGAERVFLSVADYIAHHYQAEIHFVIDNISKKGTENLVTDRGFKLIGLKSIRTVDSIVPLRNYLNIHKPDILISAYTDTNMAALLSEKLAKHRCPVIVSEHASLHDHWQYASLKRRLLLNFYVKFGYKLASHILTVSQGIASQINNMGHANDKVSCIYNPVRFGEAKSKSPLIKINSESPIILAVGRITKQKDYLTLLRSFKLLLEKKNARLVIVGPVHEDSEKLMMEDFIENNNLTSKVELVGFAENMEIHYRNADIFVLSSAWEGFGNVIVEALAFGLPVVSTNCKYGPAEILKNEQYGKLVPVADPKSLCDAIFEVLEKKPFTQTNQIERAKDFSEEVIGEMYYQLFHRLVTSADSAK
jgi:glycosyltransferase involved in cell wall biosynthesis